MVSENFPQIDAEIRREEVVELMRGLQAFQSFPPNEAPCMPYLAEWLRARGVAAGLPEMRDEPGRVNLVARLRGSGGGRSLMFNGHLDIDPIPDNYPGRPWECFEADGKLYGHGLGNMKAGMAAMAAATVAIERARVPIAGDLLYTAVVGELQGGVGAVELVRQGYLGDCALVGEPSGDLKIATQHAGALQMLIHVMGESAHVGSLHRVSAINAIEKMGKVVDRLKDLKFDTPSRPEFPGLPRLVVGGIQGGFSRTYDRWRSSLVPDLCTIIVEVRGLPGQDWDKTRDEVEAALQQLAREDPDLPYQLEVPPATYRQGWEGNKVVALGIDVPRDHYLPQSIARHHRDVMGQEPEWTALASWNDSGHYTAAGSTSVVYGPSSKRDEKGVYVEIDRVIAAARVQARTAVEVCTTPK